MSSTFIATVSQKKSAFMIDSRVSVCKQIANNSYAPIAYIHDSADPADHRQTKIHFAGGTLYFSAAYDGPLQEHSCSYLKNEAHRNTDISLHEFPHAGKICLCSSKGAFPVTKAYHRGMFELRIYQQSSLVSDEGLLYTVLAKVMQTQRTEHGYAYMIQVEEDVPDSLLMAILSLPFTLNMHS